MPAERRSGGRSSPVRLLAPSIPTGSTEHPHPNDDQRPADAALIGTSNFSRAVGLVRSGVTIVADHRLHAAAEHTRVAPELLREPLPRDRPTAPQPHTNDHTSKHP